MIGEKHFSAKIKFCSKNKNGLQIKQEKRIFVAVAEMKNYLFDEIYDELFF